LIWEREVTPLGFDLGTGSDPARFWYGY